MTQNRVPLGEIGIWAASLRDRQTCGAAAAELEALGFQAVWVPGGGDGDILEILEALLDATNTLTLASGILNIWRHRPQDVSTWWRTQSVERRSRVLLGLGVSHELLIGDRWGKPLSVMREFLDELTDIPAAHLCLAALGPKMLALSAERTAGAHPYLATAGHTEVSRAVLGPDALLAPELGVVLETDPTRARDYARNFVRLYATLTNYTNSWRREGFTEAEIENLDDRLIDALFAWGDIDAIRTRIAEHHVAGADHVCLQVVGPTGITPDLGYDRERWRELAKLL